jgi:nucleoside-diphosphate-sugar epimerase
VEKMNTQIIPDYYKAKIAADEALTVLGEERAKKDGFAYLLLRPGGLKDGEPEGKIVLGKTPAKGLVTRADVADVAVRLLEKEGLRGWFDLLGGDNETSQEVERVVREGVNSMDEESLEAMRANI